MITDLLESSLQKHRKSGGNIHSILNNIVKEYPICNLLIQLISDEKAISLVADKSYIHSNGFIKIVLAELGLTCLKLRLHIWQNEEPIIDSHIHNHAWNYTSFVCTGFLNMDLFKETTKGDYSFNKFKVGNLKNKSAINCGLVSLKDYDRKKILKGDFYSLEINKIHRISTNKHTATLVLQDDHIVDHSYVYINQNKILDNPYLATKLSKEHLKNHLNLLLDKIKD